MDGMVHNNGSYSGNMLCMNVRKVVYLYVYIKGKCELPNAL